MLVLALTVAVSTADLQQWIEDQPAVAAYERQRSVERPPGEDVFRSRPTLSQQTACRGSGMARAAAVVLFKAVDSSKLLLTEPALLTKNDGEPVLQLRA